MNILDLDKKSISQMTKSELFDTLMAIRKSRRIPAKKAKKVAAKKESKKVSLKVETLSPEAAQALLDKLTSQES